VEVGIKIMRPVVVVVDLMFLFFYKRYFESKWVVIKYLYALVYRYVN
jgi:hypothetical protein